jgi:hypothetical protein
LAGLYVALPAWLARTVQIPASSKMILVPCLVGSTAQTVSVVVVKLTDKPEEAVARTVTGDCEMPFLVIVPKSIT